jgi:hypothetical protein
MRWRWLVAFIIYVLVSEGAIVSGPFSSSTDCESSRVSDASFEYCVPLWH